MGPFLFSALWAMVLWGFIQLFIRWGACSKHLLHALGVWLTCSGLMWWQASDNSPPNTGQGQSA